MTGTPADWSPSQHGPWLRLRPEYRDVYGLWDHRAWRLSGRLTEYWYYWRCRLWTRWNVVRVRTLAPVYTDRSELLLHVAFQVFTDYMERERDQIWSSEACREDMASGDGWSADELPRAIEREALYEWWTRQRAIDRQAEQDALSRWHDAFQAAGGMKSEPTDNARLHRLVFPEKTPELERLHAEHARIEAENDARDQEMLRRLIDIREGLWT